MCRRKSRRVDRFELLDGELWQDEGEENALSRACYYYASACASVYRTDVVMTRPNALALSLASLAATLRLRNCYRTLKVPIDAIGFGMQWGALVLAH